MGQWWATSKSCGPDLVQGNMLVFLEISMLDQVGHRPLNFSLRILVKS